VISSKSAIFLLLLNPKIILPHSIEAADVETGFLLIPALSVSNATLELIFASFYRAYTGPNDDLWLAAHQNITRYNIQNTDNDSPDCVELYQICSPFPKSNATTARAVLSIAQMHNHVYAREEFQKILSNNHQIASTMALSIAAVFSSFYFTAFGLISPLLAERPATGQSSLPLASNRCTEARNWFAISLADFQRLLVEYITRPPAQFAPFVPQNQAQSDPALQWLCENQIIGQNDFTNFSSLAIGLVFGFGTLVIGISLCLEMVTGLVRLKWWRGRSK